MKFWIKKMLIYILIVCTLFTSSIYAYAHTTILNVGYDECELLFKNNGSTVDKGEDEIWYYLVSERDCTVYYNGNYMEVNEFARHLPQYMLTVRYCFADSAREDSNYTWTTDILKEYRKTMSEEEALEEAEKTAEEIKKAYADSMKKWNDIYYYSYDENGTRTARKIINIEEGTADTADIIIYPINHYEVDDNPLTTHNEDITYAACVGPNQPIYDVQENTTNPYHFHCSNWYMNVNVALFFEHSKSIENGRIVEPGMLYYQMMYNRKKVGMHEMGHVLGLFDVDVECHAENYLGSDVDHHKELLMGYGDYGDAEDASYQDIAGVSITRGFHHDSDHVWMLRNNDNGTMDVICAQCNGVRKNISLTDGKYEGKTVNAYKSCVHHGGTNEEMLLVATDGERNFFKCQYCRYIETLSLSEYISANPCSETTISNEINVSQSYHRLVISRAGVYNFKSNELQNLVFTLCDDNLNSMGYSFDASVTNGNFNVYLDEGTYYLRINKNVSGTRDYNISITPTNNPHEFSAWTKLSSTHHIECCKYCGLTGTTTALHYVKQSEVSNNIGFCVACGARVMLGDDFIQVGPLNISKVTINGSYILPNGIIVLVDEDIEAYENGTLVWYDKDKLPQTQ